MAHYFSSKHYRCCCISFRFSLLQNNSTVAFKNKNSFYDTSFCLCIFGHVQSQTKPGATANKENEPFALCSTPQALLEWLNCFLKWTTGRPHMVVVHGSYTSSRIQQTVVSRSSTALRVDLTPLPLHSGRTFRTTELLKNYKFLHHQLPGLFLSFWLIRPHLWELYSAGCTISPRILSFIFLFHSFSYFLEQILKLIGTYLKIRLPFKSKCLQYMSSCPCFHCEATFYFKLRSTYLLLRSSR